MNLYVVVEGIIGERRVYESWIQYASSQLIYVPTIFDIDNNHFSVIAGGGYPNYFDVVESAIEDVNSVGNIDRLVVSVDSEEMSFEEKLEELTDFVNQIPCRASIHIVIQHFCLETWALGNKRVGPRNPKSVRLREYKTIYNVLALDPELLPAHPNSSLNRAQFAERYLRALLNDKNRNLTYYQKQS